MNTTQRFTVALLLAFGTAILCDGALLASETYATDGVCTVEEEEQMRALLDELRQTREELTAMERGLKVLQEQLKAAQKQGNGLNEVAQEVQSQEKAELDIALKLNQESLETIDLLLRCVTAPDLTGISQEELEHFMRFARGLNTIWGEYLEEKERVAAQQRKVNKGLEKVKSSVVRELERRRR